MRNLLIFVLAVLFSINAFAQKSAIMKTKITKDNLIKISEQIIGNNEFSKEEIDDFSKGIARIGVFRDSLVTLTVKDVIEYQKRYIRGAYAKNLLKIAARVEMVMNTNFNYVGISAKDEDEQPKNLVIYEIENLSDKKIVHLEGTLTYYTPDNRIVKIFNLRTKEIIEPEQNARIGQIFIHNPENKRDILIRTSNELKVVWNPVYLEYEDGDKLGEPLQDIEALEPKEEIDESESE